MALRFRALSALSPRDTLALPSAVRARAAPPPAKVAYALAVTRIQLVDCFFNRVFKHDRGPVIQRVSECRVRLNPRNGEGKRTIERACSAQGVCRRAQVVKKTRLCDLGG